MQNIQLIDILKKPVTEVIEYKRIAPSLLIAECIYTLNLDENIYIMDDLIANNNPFAIKAGKKYTGKIYKRNNIRYKSFSSMDLGIRAFINAHSYRFNKISNLFNYNDALERDTTLSDAKKEELSRIIIGFNLDKLDSVLLETIYDSDKNIIEIPEENENTKFYQKMHNCEPEKEKVTPELVIRREYEKREKQYKEKIQRGSKITLTNANLYQEARSKFPIRNINGEYYISTKVENNRCGIVMKQEYIGKDIFLMGYINISEIK